MDTPAQEPESSAMHENSSRTDSEHKHNTNGQQFECNICLDIAHEAVISLCGHLFCWPCLHQWLETRPNRPACPVCKSAIGRDKVVPLYGRSGDHTDPRDNAPPRPPGQRTEPQSGFSGFNWGNGPDGGFQFSFGIGAFPFTFFASTLNFGDRRPTAPAPGSREYNEEQFISKAWVCVAVIFMMWLLLA